MVADGSFCLSDVNQCAVYEESNDSSRDWCLVALVGSCRIFVPIPMSITEPVLETVKI